MPFTPVTYNTGAAPGIDGPAMNALQTQYQESINSFEQDLFTAWVRNGLVPTRDGTTLSQLDVTAGVAFVLQTDGTLRRRAPTATTFSATGNASTTMYLDLNPDGTWSWGTAHSAQSGYLVIAQVTTDASANIATVTDVRPLDTTLLNGITGALRMPTTLKLQPTINDDALKLYDRNAVEGAHIGWEYSGAGFYIWDQVNSSYIMRYGTKNAMTIYGALTFGAYDGSLSTVRLIRTFEGTADPSTYTTPNEGDLWADG